MARRLANDKRIWIACAAGLLAVLPLAVPAVTLMKLMCYALFALGFNLLFGVVGLLSFGHAAFFGGGAYAAAGVLTQLGASPEIALVVGTLFAAALGAVFGFFAVRRQKLYFAMVTLAFAQLFYFFCLHSSLTGGEDGIQGVSRGKLFGIVDLSVDLHLYALVSVVFLSAIVMVWRIVRSPFGSLLRAIRDNEARVTSLGVRVEHHKWTAFILSAALCGLAGSLKVLVFQFATLADVSWQASGDAIVMTLLGGAGSLLGPVSGAVIYTGLQSLVTSFELPASLVTGAIFVLCVLGLRRGLAGLIEDAAAKVSSGKALLDKGQMVPPR
jgi:branched-chain amino acid transport system permease protein